jgi:hypothetical protein
MQDALKLRGAKAGLLSRVSFNIYSDPGGADGKAADALYLHKL